MRHRFDAGAAKQSKAIQAGAALGERGLTERISLVEEEFGSDRLLAGAMIADDDDVVDADQRPLADGEANVHLGVLLQEHRVAADGGAFVAAVAVFGGNPLAAAVARAALRVIREEKLAERSQELGEYFLEQLSEIPSPHVKEVRGKGLLIGIELKPEAKGARRFCEALQEKGILAKETHGNVIRFAPPLVIDKETIDWALPSIRDVLNMK